MTDSPVKWRPRAWPIAAIGSVAVFAAACGGAGPSDDVASETGAPPGPGTSLTASAAPAAPATSTLPATTPQPSGARTLVGETLPTPTSAPLPPPTITPTPFMSIEDITEAAIAERFALLSGWQTDFRRGSVSLSEIEAILPRDRIQPVDRPEFASVSKPPDYMRANEPVIAVRAGSDARAGASATDDAPR